jgi:hypothetical protein
MCWSASASLNTYALAMTMAAIIKWRGKLDPRLFAYLILFIHMQLIEYFLWKNIDRPDANAFWSQIGLFAILLQPIFLLRLVNSGALRGHLLVAYLTAMLIGFLINRPKFTTEIGVNGHLKWNWFPVNTFQGLAWMAAFFIPLLLWGDLMALGLGIVTVLGSAYFYRKSGELSTMWCWLAALTSVPLAFHP